MKRTYVIHCERCNRLISTENQHQQECPPENVGKIDFSKWGKLDEMRPYTKKFDGTFYYPNVGKSFDSHRDYEKYLKATGREIITDGHRSWDKKDEAYIGNNLRSGEYRKSKTIYFT